MSRFADRYGIAAKDVDNLSSKYKKQKLKEGFGSFDNFLKFCAEVGYKPGMRMYRYYPEEPHSPDNTYFYAKGEKINRPEKNAEKDANRICADCQKVPCTASGSGCPAYRKAWIENWNKNIHRKKPEDPNRKQFFCYEHPDLIREGIIFGREKK